MREEVVEKEEVKIENMARLLEILQILGKYDEKNLQADRGIIYLNTIVPSKVDKDDVARLEELDCEYSSHFMKWFINT